MMCGIYACLHVSVPSNEKSRSTINCVCHCTHIKDSILKRRGPDASSSKIIYIRDKVKAIFFASVLHLRGTSVVQQPYEDSYGNLLLWNGEIFHGLEVDDEECDTARLSKCLSDVRCSEGFIKVISSIKGPWSFIYWQEDTKCLWFGRDIFGRRSLLWKNEINNLGTFSLCSVGLEDRAWKEVPADGLYCLDLNEKNLEKNINISKYSWNCSVSGKASDWTSGEVSEGNFMDFHSYTSEQWVLSPLKCCLNDSEPRLEDVVVVSPVDCGQLKRLSGIGSLKDNEDKESVSKQLDQMDLNSYNVESTLESSSLEDKIFISYLRINKFKSLVSQFIEVLAEAVKLRVLNQPLLCKDCLCNLISNDTDKSKEMTRKERKKMPVCVHAPIAVMFSGGLDSVILAYLADRFLPRHLPIDLLNVAFEHKVRMQSTSKKETHSSETTYDTPDRITGKEGVNELSMLKPHRKWNFVEINITRNELQSQRQDCIRQLVYPCATVLDDSLGCASWFAARGSGVIWSDSNSYEPYTSPARVVLLGMGADEQLAGYSRHRVKFKNKGWKGLIEEVALEIDRISSRNLGRDDRVITDHGREGRFPYLDESVVCFLNSLPMWYKADLSLPRGVGEKLLLRLVAFQLGLKKAASLPKRAMQFGSRIAKTEDSKEKGSDACGRLKQTKMI
ncbi:asparagine synthetase domain-containing protein 1-like isoform X2 [Limulus polyphemus]|nr:asparagine synthetase domain-containing protein 1-like isoform X2 [Limulus polyphemus]XP_022256061.1 asparagine synthetase domain-containing protein 1-like isoform X2 [Limulus polyphemus]